MKVEFYNEDGESLVTAWVDTDDHWEACDYGHDMLAKGTIVGAEDFQVIYEEPRRTFGVEIELNSIPLSEAIFAVDPGDAKLMSIAEKRGRAVNLDD